MSAIDILKILNKEYAVEKCDSGRIRCSFCLEELDLDLRESKTSDHYNDCPCHEAHMFRKGINTIIYACKPVDKRRELKLLKEKRDSLNKKIEELER